MSRITHRRPVNPTSDDVLNRSSTIYGWIQDNDTDECELFMQRLSVIQRKPLAIWPPPKQLEWMGKKVSDSKMLAIIAKESNRPHPSTSVLDLATLTDVTMPDDTVLKRGNSDCGTHVLFPSNRTRRRRCVADLQAMSPFGELWLSQEFIPTLQTIGEWRVFIVNGSIIHTIHTCKVDDGVGWAARQVMSFWSLNEIR